MTKKKELKTEKVSKKVVAKKTAVTKGLNYKLKVKSKFNVKNAPAQVLLARPVTYKAICLHEKIDLTDWVDEVTADNVASQHMQIFLHPVSVLELH